MAQTFDGTLRVSSWGATKFVETSDAAVDQVRISQRVNFTQKSISVGWVSSYLLVSNPDPTVSFTLTMEVRLCDADGFPLDLLASGSIPSSSLSGNDWYRFDIELDEMENPENGLCFIYWQTGGDENNYASWGYNNGDYSGASISSDSGSTWTAVSNIHRVMRVASYFDAYSEVDPNKRICSPEGTESVGTSFEGGEFDNTKLVSEQPPYGYGYDTSDQRRIVLDTRDLHVSLVTDSSGSMGWKDRFGIRKEVAEEIVSRFSATYPGDVTFDFVNFGGRPLDILGVSQTQKVLGVFVSVDDISFISGYDADGNPLSGADVRDHLGSGIVSYGYKNLKSGTEYVNYGFDVRWKDETTFSSPGVKWVDVWPTDSPALSSSALGPEDKQSMTISVSDSGKNAVRYVFGNDPTVVREVPSSNVFIGDELINVDNDPAIFENGGSVNVVDIDGISPLKRVIDSSGTTLSVGSQFFNNHYISNGAVVENSMPEVFDLGWEQTDGIEFFILDPLQKGDITFYVQTANGAHIEWTFTPLASWEYLNLYFLDETATFVVDTLDANGDPLPDGTTVEFYVDKDPESDLDIDTENEQEVIPLTQDAEEEEDFVYVSLDNVEKLTRGDSIDIIDDNRNPQGLADGGVKEYHTTTISEIATETGKITLSDELPSDFLVSDSAAILLPSTSESEFEAILDNPLSIVAGLVDVTPIYLGKEVPDEFRDALDPPQADPNADYDDYNADPSRVREGSVELVTVDGYAAVRLLPVTEDRFTRQSSKDDLAKSMFDLTDREEVRKQALDDYEEGLLKEGVDDSVLEEDVPVETEEEEPQYFDGENPDFIIDHKVTSVSGEATTDMTSFATELKYTELGSVSPRDYLAKEYEIYPVMTLYDNAGEKYAIILMDSFEVYFASPIFIKSSVDSTVTYHDCPPPAGDPEALPYSNDVPGTFATEEKEITISYDVSDKDFPANGTLTVSIYDGMRTVETANVQDADIGNPNGCNDFDSIEGIDNIESAEDNEEDEYTQSLSDKILADDILGPDFSSEFTLEVVAGQASFTLPQIDRVGILEVHAEFEYGDEGRKVVNRQKVYYKNPIVLRLLGMGGAPADGESKVNIGASVWWKEEYPVDDGTIVNFQVPKSPATPTVSETISGIADGVVVGPHEPIPIPTTAGDLLDPEAGKDVETVTGEVSFRGFTTSTTGDIIWGGGEPPPENFYFYAKADRDSIWADGYDYVVVNGDLPASSFRAFPFIDQVYEDLVADRMGVVYSGSGLKAETRLPRWTDVRPSEGFSDSDDDVPYGWVTNRMTSNKFIGRPPYREPLETGPQCATPECTTVSLFTRSRKNNVVGVGIDSETVSFPQTTPSGKPADIPKPEVKLIEPLGITMSMEPIDRSEYQGESEWRKTPLGASPKSSGFDQYNHPIIRDGESRYWVVAEITWRDEFIFNTASNPFPEVLFEAGTYESDSETGDITFEPFTDPNEAPIDAPSATVEYLRTTADADHYHEVSVDANGIGKTIATISYGSEIVDDHEHDININSTTVISEETAGTVIHGHSLRSVAIIGMGPVRNRTLPIAIKGTVTYDNGKIPSSGVRIERELENYAFTSPIGDAEETEGEGYKLEIITASKQYLEGRVVDSFPTRPSLSGEGYTVLYKATLVKDGEEFPVEDGTRIFTNFSFFEFNDDESGDKPRNDVMVISRDEEVKNYAVLKVNGFFSDLPDEAEAERQIMISSGVRWFPSVAASDLIREPANDPLYLQGSIDEFTEIGSSQLNDAVSLAARRMIKFADQIGESKKIIIVLSDMNESQSDYSYDQALADVAAVSSVDPVEVFAVKVADVDRYSDLVAQKYAVGSGGDVISITDIDTAEQGASDAVDEIINSPSFDATRGTYTNTVDLGESKLFSALRFNYSLETGTDMTFRVRFSSDGRTYGEWTTLGSGVEFDIESFGKFDRYMQYEVTLFGNVDNFDSPEFTGMEYDYIEPGNYTMFFKPVQIREGADGYVGEIIFTHYGTIPDNSEVRYGISHSDTSDLSDFGWVHQPLLEDGFGGIVLSRVNEPLQRSDSINYTAPYGGWSAAYEAEVYRISTNHPNGIIVDPSTYSLDSTAGKVVFVQPQSSSDSFTITLGMKQEFTIAVNMVNYGSEAACIDYIGAMYRTVDRSDIYSESRKSVASVLDTNLGLLDVSGTLSVTGVSFVTEIGKDSDEMKDVFFLDDIYYVLAYDTEEQSSYVATLASNFTFIERFELSIPGVPQAFDMMDGLWSFSYLDGSAIKVVRTDTSFENIFTSDFGFVDEHSAVIRSNVDRWYTTNTSTIDIYSRSFDLVDSIPLDYEISTPLSVDSDDLTAISIKNDIIFVFSLDGSVSKAYSLETRASATNNIRRVDGAVLIVENARITSGTLS